MSNIPPAGGRNKYSCKYPGCSSRYYAQVTDPNYQNKRFHRFPADAQLCSKWKQICKMKPSDFCVNKYLCEDHFKESDFMNFFRKRLNWNAVPLPTSAEESREEENPSDDPQRTIYVSNEDNNETDSPDDDFKVQNLITTDVTKTGEGTTQYLFEDSSNCGNVSEFHNNEADLEDPFDIPISLCLEIEDILKATSDSENLDHSLKDSVENAMHGIEDDIGFESRETAKMFAVHRLVITKFTKIQDKLQNRKEHFAIISHLYKSDKFSLIEEDLKNLSKEFIHSQLSHVKKEPTDHKWNLQDKLDALLINKQSSRLYRYLYAFFIMPPKHLLRSLLSKIPLNNGEINETMLHHLKEKVQQVDVLDRSCAFLFDEISLSLLKESQEKIVSFSNESDYTIRIISKMKKVLIIMIRGVRKPWKQVISYYFSTNTLSPYKKKSIILKVISQLQSIGLRILATVCKQSLENQNTISLLCEQHSENQNELRTFFTSANGDEIVVIFNVPHLLKSTRNALLHCNIQFEDNKFAKFEYIEAQVAIDQKKMFKSLKLGSEDFNFGNPDVLAKVRGAARQLGHRMAANLETYVVAGKLPEEAMHTAEFSDKIACLFDSLNGSSLHPEAGELFRCAVSKSSDHLKFWFEILEEIPKWKLINLKTRADDTWRYSFLKGWVTTIKSVMYLWSSLQNKGFRFLSCRFLTLDPLENLIYMMKKCDPSNNNPMSSQFTTTLKTIVLNNMTLQIINGNCESDECFQLDNLRDFLKRDYDDGDPLFIPSGY